jgi:CubicO group peptidase (beta-lactamase class C family)
MMFSGKLMKQVFLLGVILLVIVSSSCGGGGWPTAAPASNASPAVTDVPSQTGLEEPVYRPLERDDWAVSTPSNQGLDPETIGRLYEKAEKLPNLYSLLIIKDGNLVSERYFNGQSASIANPTASVTKSYVSALTGIALREGVLTSVDQKLMDFFPEFAGQYSDPRKDEITIRQVLQMRSGYPWEERSPYLDDLFSSPNWLPHLVDFPLSADPGAQFGYSNLTAHVMGIILARASKSSLRAFGQTHLFKPLGVTVGSWPKDASGYYFGSGDIAFTPRDMAKFGLLYLNGGMYDGKQIIPSDWVSESLQPYSSNIYNNRLGSYFRDIEYGYLWWSARVGKHHFNYAWGHGGQLIVILHDLNMVIVTTADHLPGQFGEAAWEKERAVIDLVGWFLKSL